jgi:hypothetical protein
MRTFRHCGHPLLIPKLLVYAQESAAKDTLSDSLQNHCSVLLKNVKVIIINKEHLRNCHSLEEPKQNMEFWTRKRCQVNSKHIRKKGPLSSILIVPARSLLEQMCHINMRS